MWRGKINPPGNKGGLDKYYVEKFSNLIGLQNTWPYTLLSEILGWSAPVFKLKLAVSSFYSFLCIVALGAS